MSNAWETTIDDVRIVFKRHGIKIDEKQLNQIYEDLDHEEIEDRLLDYTDMEYQTNSMLSDIEDQLIERGFIYNDKKFLNEYD